MRRLDGGNWLLGYGRLPELTEFGPDGRVLLDASLGNEPLTNYTDNHREAVAAFSNKRKPVFGAS